MSTDGEYSEAFAVDLVAYLMAGLPVVVAIYALLLWTQSRRSGSRREDNKPSRRKRSAKKRLPVPQKEITRSVPVVTSQNGQTKELVLPRAATGSFPIKLTGHSPSVSRTDPQEEDEVPKISRLGHVLTNDVCEKCGIVAAKRRCRYNYCGGCCRSKYMSVCGAHNTGVRVAEQLMDEALQVEPFELDFSYQHLRFCPNRIGAIGHSLTSLNLSNNRLLTLPEELGNLVNLEELFLQYNSLQALPQSVGNLVHLVEFDCKNNQLTSVPESIGNLINLNILNLTNNRLQILPCGIGRMSKLEELCLHSNCLLEVPPDISNLHSLNALYLGENCLKALPHDIGRLCRLNELDISNNELLALPESLVSCTALSRLWLSHNKLTSLPARIGCLDQLVELHVRHNQFRFLPLSLVRLKLFTFTSSENPLLTQWNRAAIRRLESHPKQQIPSLLELAARAVVQHDISRQPGDLPCKLEDMLSSVRRCSNCFGPFFSFYSSRLIFCTVAVFFRLPLLELRCCPHSDKLCPSYKI